MKVPGILHARITAWIFLTVSVVVTIWGAHIAGVYVRKNAEAQFQSEVGRTRRVITRRMQEYQELLRGAAGLFQAKGTVDRQTWKTYVKALDIQKNYPGAPGMGFSLRIPAGEKLQHEWNVHAEGFPEYRIWPEEDREEYYSNVYLEPLNSNSLGSLGYDMFTDPVRRAAMERARDTGEPALSGTVKLVQDSKKAPQPSFLLYIPVYRQGAPHETVEEKRAALYGFVFIPFRARDLMKGMLMRNVRDLELEAFDGDNISRDTLFYDSDETTQVHSHAALFDVRTVEVAGRTWTLSFYSTPEFEAGTASREPTLIAVAGLLIDALLFFIFLSFSRQGARARELVRRVTMELRESREELQAVAETANDAIVSSDSNGAIIHFNQSASLMFGYAPEEVLGKSCSILFPQRFRITHMLGLRELTADNTRPESIGRTVELVGLHRSGNEFPFEISLASWSSVRGRCFTGIIRDISKRKLDELRLKESLAEKETLLKEVHHRVKNNLQIISSLFSLQSSHVGDPQLLDLCKESQNRVKTMALIHERLYQTPGLAQIDFAEYAKDLAHNLSRSFRLNPLVSVVVDVRGIYLGVDMAVPCGLILNELLSNAFKHAFPGSRSGNVHVEFYKTEAKLILNIHDDGIGLPPGLGFQQADSLGFRLVTTLVQHQLQGRLSVQSAGGTTIRIELPRPGAHEKDPDADKTSVPIEAEYAMVR